MKSVLITFDQAYYERIMALLDRLGCRGLKKKKKAFFKRSFFERQYLRKLKREDYLKISKRKKLEKYNAIGLLTKYYTH